VKKKKSNTPNRKRFKKPARLDSAKYWIEKYEGKNIVKGYANWYGTSKLTAVNELKILGIQIDENYIKQLEITEENIVKRNREKKDQKALFKKIENDEIENINEYSEESHSFDLMEEKIENDFEEKKCLKCIICDDEELPF